MLSEREINLAAGDFLNQMLLALIYVSIGAMMSGARRSGHCCIVFCLVFLLMDVSSTDAEHVPTGVNQYQSLQAHIPRLSHWLQYLGGLLYQFGDAPLFRDAFEGAKQDMLHHLRSCVTILAGATGVRAVLQASTAHNKRRKTGKKSGGEKATHDEMVKTMLIGFFQDKECQSLHAYLVAHGMEFVRHSVQRTINANERLKYIQLRDRRKDPRLVKEALDIICGRKDDSNKENNRNNNESNVGDINVAQERTIYNFTELKRIADGLNFQTRPRVSRDGECMSILFWLLIF